jgi:HSP20 family protein
MDHMFGDFFGTNLDRGDRVLDTVWNPYVDIAETDNEIIVSAELPGVGKDDVKISIQDDTLVLRGEKRQEKDEKKENYHRVERSYGAFQRTIGLPVSADSGKIKAKFKDGVLKINLPKKEEAKLKEIPISVE